MIPCHPVTSRDVKHPAEVLDWAGVKVSMHNEVYC